MENQIEIINENQRDVELLEKNRKINLQKLFTPEGMDLIIAEIQKEVADFTADIATKEGRAKIISMAAKIAKCKSPIKNLASELKEESKKLIDGVNSQWNRYEKAMDDLRDSVRKPVDEIEEKEAKILKEKQDRLSEIERLSTTRSFNSLQDLKGLLQDLEQAFNYDWNDFQFKAKSHHDIAKNYLELEIEKFIKYEAEQAELIKLKKEKAEREKKDSEEKKVRDEILIEKRKIEIQNIVSQDLFSYLSYKRKIEIVSLNFLLEPDEKIWQEELKLIALERDEIIKKREISQKEAEEQAEKKAKKAIEDAIEKERQQVAENARKEAEAVEKREANKRHRNKIEKKVLADIQLFVRMMTETESIGILSQNDLILLILKAVAFGEIPNLTINY